MRKIVFHYHLFKNAGTSVDEMLKASFGPAWVTREFQGGAGVVHHQMVDWIRGEPAAVAWVRGARPRPTSVGDGMAVRGHAACGPRRGGIAEVNVGSL